MKTKMNILPRYDEVAEVIETNCGNEADFVCKDGNDLLDVLVAYQAYHQSLSRTPLAEAWKGPGVYRFYLDGGVGQAVDAFKTDTAVVRCIHIPGEVMKGEVF